MNDLLANKDYQFSPIDIKDNNNFRNFYVRKIIETRKINMVLNNFSSLKSDSLNPINTKLILKIHQNEARKTNFKEKYQSIYYTFNESRGRGTYNFCSKEDKLDPSNGFYNKENDSILLQATVKILS
jgi:hypothetical protein